MPPQLSDVEVRVMACLLEKQVTTPEQYPLSLNALQSACNQKSNRDPVLELPEAEVQAALDSLARRHLVLERSGFGSRVPKYQQRLCNTEFSTLQLSAQERAVLCELMLRGAQTPGELRSRAARMAAYADVGEVESALEALMRRTDGALVMRLTREPGRREQRYAHLLGPARPEGADADARDPGSLPAAATLPTQSQVSGMAPAAEPAGRGAAGHDAALEGRVQVLELQVAELIAGLAALRQRDRGA